MNVRSDNDTSELGLILEEFKSGGEESVKNDHSIKLRPFLVASTQFYKRVCASFRRSIGPSVHRSVGPSVHRSNGPSVRRSVRPSVRPSIGVIFGRPKMS